MDNQQSVVTYIECPYCGKKLKFLNATHLKRHGKTVSDVKSEFPNQSLASQSYRDRQREDTRDRWEEEGYRDRVSATLNIPFEYESIRYEYKIDGFRLYHVVDFYIPKYNLIIEVKPSYKFKDGFIKNHNEEYRKIIAKRDGGIALGYNYIFITEDNLDSKDSFYKAISKYM